MTPATRSPLPRLQARGLVKRFGARTALRGVDLDVADGESLAVVGRSGSGASTLLHLLAGVLVPDAGCVRLRGRDLALLDEPERSSLRRRHYGFVLASGQLLPELSAAENVALPAMLLGAPRARALEHARQWLAALGLGALEDRRPGELSRAQTQRVAVARALITGPDVVLADEPTAGLDAAAGAELMRLLAATTRAAGASLVVVTHDRDVAAWCSRRIELRDGVVTAEGVTAPEMAAR
jgi:putative ABC transport system ATP-binding protein